MKVSASLENESRHPIANALVKEAKKQNIDLLTIQNIYTESGRGISGELETINGIIHIGSVEWLVSKGVEIDDSAKSSLENKETKKNHYGCSRSSKLRLSDFQLFSQTLSWSVKMPASSQRAFARAELQTVMQGDAACLHKIT